MDKQEWEQIVDEELEHTTKALAKAAKRSVPTDGGELLLLHNRDLEVIILRTLLNFGRILSYELEAQRRAIREEIKNYLFHQITMYNGQLPFVVFNGKATETEKVSIYEQAFKDVLDLPSLKD